MITNKAKKLLTYLQNKSYETRVRIVWTATIITFAVVFIFLGKVLLKPAALSENNPQNGEASSDSKQIFNLPKLSSGIYANLAELKNIFGGVKEILNKDIKMDNEPREDVISNNLSGQGKAENKEIYKFPVAY